MLEASLQKYLIVFGFDDAYFLLQVGVAIGKLLLHAFLFTTLLVSHLLNKIYTKTIDFPVRHLKDLVERLSIRILAFIVNGPSQLLDEPHLIQFI